MPDWLDSVVLVAWMLVIFGIVLGIADRFGRTNKAVADIGWPQALMIGLAQALALIPGVSRAGITMTAARFLGLSRAESARFSLLLGTIAIAGAGVLSAIGLAEINRPDLWRDAGICLLLAFGAGYAVIYVMMAWLKRASLMPFAVYRIALGLLLLALVYSGTLG